jgi:hypothetical protein
MVGFDTVCRRAQPDARAWRWPVASSSHRLCSPASALGPSGRGAQTANTATRCPMAWDDAHSDQRALIYGWWMPAHPSAPRRCEREAGRSCAAATSKDRRVHCRCSLPGGRSRPSWQPEARSFVRTRHPAASQRRARVLRASALRFRRMEIAVPAGPFPAAIDCVPLML